MPESIPTCDEDFQGAEMLVTEAMGASVDLIKFQQFELNSVGQERPWAELEDWKDVSSYDYTCELSLHQWAWEFLRRNREYRHLWDQLSKMARELEVAGEPPDKEYEYRRTVGAYFGMGWAIDYRLRAYEASNLFWMASSGVKLVSKYLQHGTLPPEESGNWPGFPDHVVALFNLKKPLLPQVQKIDTLLHHYQELVVKAGLIARPVLSEARAKVGHYKLYLRILDAHLAGMSQAKIGEALFPDASDPRGKVRYRLKRASALARDGYLQLLLKADL